ncbi:hypothetical protein GOBAR_DD20874 [Gossypium barbadense]|nr:hypothetical protein GOBAR_DD20874 [Gossypium barbadense]
MASIQPTDTRLRFIRLPNTEVTFTNCRFLLDDSFDQAESYHIGALRRMKYDYPRQFSLSEYFHKCKDSWKLCFNFVNFALYVDDQNIEGFLEDINIETTVASNPFDTANLDRENTILVIELEPKDVLNHKNFNPHGLSQQFPSEGGYSLNQEYDSDASWDQSKPRKRCTLEVSD